MPNTIPSLSSAFRLGRVLEELASINRKEVAIHTIRSCDSSFDDESILSVSHKEVELTKEQVFSYCTSIIPYLPGKILEVFQRLDDSDPAGMGRLDVQQLGMLHGAIAGLIEESMPQRTVWNCLQMGRLIQRSWLTISNIRDTLINHRHMPNNSLLSYIALRTDNPVPNLDKGTHLWNVHRVFQAVLKQEKNPKSLLSTLNRLYPHLSDVPVPEALKKDHENMIMTLNRVTNDLSFIDVHEMIGDDPEDHLAQIMDFFDRHERETQKLTDLIRNYLQAFECYIKELSEDEIFEFEL